MVNRNHSRGGGGGGGVHTDLQFGRARGDRVGESIVVRDLKVSSAF